MSNRAMRACSILLTAIMLFNMLPLNSFAEEYREGLLTAPVVAETSTAELATEELKAAQITEEVVSKRTEYSKEFMLTNGLHMAVVYPDAVHFQRDGQWKEIDNTLKSVRGVGSTAYTNTAGVWQVSFPGSLSANNDVTIEKDGYTLSFFMAGELRTSGGLSTAAIGGQTAEQFDLHAAKTAAAQVQHIDLTAQKAAAEHPEMVLEKQHSRLQYADVYEDTNIIYDLSSNEVKESVVLEQYSSTLRGYQYTLSTGSMIPVLNEDESISLYDEQRQNIVMHMPAPYLVDAAEEYCCDVAVTLKGSNGTYLLTYLLPQTWLAEESRQWPVILDPVVQANTSISNIKDATVSSVGNQESFRDGSIECGVNTAYGIRRIFLKYDTLPALTSADVVVGATISMYKLQTSTNETTIQVHKLHNTWTSDSVTWSNYFGTMDANYDTNAVDYTKVRVQQWYHWNVTDIAREWYEGENTGMLFRLSDEVTDNRLGQFASSEYANATNPVLSIYFRNNNGLESYWDYSSASAGRAGTGYVNNFTGNLVFTHEDIGVGGNRLSVNIRHIYNADDADNNTYGVGLGWRMNYNQVVYQWSADASYYVWEDSDGTDHYFKLESGSTYKDEDGLELTLTTNGSGTEKYCITDKTGNKSFFDTHGRLRKIQDNQQTKGAITISYTTTSGKLIDAISDSIGRWYKLYYTDGVLNTISARKTDGNRHTIINFGHTNSRLTSVTTADNEVCTYGYNSHGLLSSVQDIDGYTLNYEYHNVVGDWQPHRVKKISETDGTAQGSELNITYAHNQTTFTDHNGNVEIHQFNDFGNTVSIQDDEGHAQFRQYDKNTHNDETGKANQLRLSSRLQNSVGSVAQDSSFEKGTVWTPRSDSITTSASTDTAYYGSYSQKIVNTVYGQNKTAYSKNFGVYSGQTVTVSAYIKNPDADTTLELHYLDSETGGYPSVKSQPVKASDSWTRAEVTLTNTGSEMLWPYIHLRVENVGTYYVDCVQIEYANAASRYNLVVNGDFRNSGVNSGSHYWIYSGFTGTDGPVHAAKSPATTLDTFAMQITGSTTATKQFYQSVATSGSAEDTYILAGWAKGDSVPLSGENRTFCLKAVFYNTDGSTTERTVNFNPDTNSLASWQYVAAPVIADKAYSSIRVYAVYGYNANTVLFDGIQLYKEEFGNSYTCDDEGNVTSVVDLQKQTTTYEYDTSKTDLLKIKQSGKAKITYTYDSYHNVKTATTAEGLVYNFTYDAYGNNTSVSITKDGVTMTSTATYSDDGNRLVSTTDALGKVTRYGYNETTNVLEWVQYPEDTEATRTNYTYDTMYRLASVACTTDTGSTLTASYTYTDDLLTKIQTGSTTYNFTYGDFSLRAGVSIGDRTLASYSYTADRNHYLEALDYGNGDKVQYTYNDLGRVTAQTYEDGSAVAYKYDNNGALAKIIDSETGITTTYYYDSADRMMKYVETGTGYSHSVGYSYDQKNNLTAVTQSINGAQKTISYTYDADNRITSVTDGAVTRSYSYDGLGRLTQQVTTRGGATALTEIYTYHTNAEGAPTAQVASKRVISPAQDITYSYSYDGNGNILSASDGTNTTSYAYDSANQLVRENNQAGGFTHTWTYDNAGNILTRAEYAYTTGALGLPTDTVSYTYSDSEWGDLLTNNDGQTVTTDAIGNMLTDGWNTYTWEHGRQLASVSNATHQCSYIYNAEGLRIQKTINGVAHNFVYAGDKLVQETYGGNVLELFYDDNGSPYCFKFNGVCYYYVTNIQGDVIQILDSSGNVQGSYEYDAWGNTISATGYAITINPIRYRGYFYDAETGLYYVSSRYYDPEIGRWINADSAIGQIGNVQGTNMFAYCFNNPVNMSDPTGNWPKLSTIFTVVAVAAVAVAAVAVTVATCGAAAPALAVAGGGIIGGISAGAAATAASVATGAMIVAGVSTAAAVTSAVAEKAVEKTAKQNNSVYVLKDNTGTVQYVGRTTDVAKRAKAHEANPARAGLKLEVIQPNLNYVQARAVEQAAMAYYHTINTANKMNNQINGISPFNPKLGIYKEAAVGMLGYTWNQVSNEILYWTGN